MLGVSRAVSAADELLAAQLAIQKNLPDETRPHLEKILTAHAQSSASNYRPLLQLAVTKNDDQRGGHIEGNAIKTWSA